MCIEFKITTEFIIDSILEKIREQKIKTKLQIRMFSEILYNTLLKNSHNGSLTLSFIHKIPGIITYSWTTAHLKNSEKIDITTFLPKLIIFIKKGMVTLSLPNKKQIILFQNKNKEILQQIKKEQIQNNLQHKISTDTKKYKDFVENYK